MGDESKRDAGKAFAAACRNELLGQAAANAKTPEQVAAAETVFKALSPPDQEAVIDVALKEQGAQQAAEDAAAAKAPAEAADPDAAHNVTETG